MFYLFLNAALIKNGATSVVAMVKSKVIQEELETRKLVERAKEVLMLRRNKTGEEAYSWIRKRSMDTRKSMRCVAEAILLSEELE